MDASEVLAVLRALEGGGIRAGISGGWGIDALLGHQSRAHRDLDLAVAAERLAAAVEVLTRRGYAVTADQRPARVELSADDRIVDLHPVRWGPDGSGIQDGFDGAIFRYPPGSMDAPGTINATAVRCATPELQVAFHSGYEPTERDRVDVAAVVEAFGMAAPPGFRSEDQPG